MILFVHYFIYFTWIHYYLVKLRTSFNKNNLLLEPIPQLFQQRSFSTPMNGLRVWVPRPWYRPRTFQILQFRWFTESMHTQKYNTTSLDTMWTLSFSYWQLLYFFEDLKDQVSFEKNSETTTPQNKQTNKTLKNNKPAVISTIHCQTFFSPDSSLICLCTNDFCEISICDFNLWFKFNKRMNEEKYFLGPLQLVYLLYKFWPQNKVHFEIISINRWWSTSEM